MYLLEEYQEVIERDAVEISFLWKFVQVSLYFLCALSGYVCTILFYILWDVFQGNCPLWAKLDLMPQVAAKLSKDSEVEADISIRTVNTNWKQYIIINYNYEGHCELFYFISLLSCVFGTVWLTMFSICGKGGYNIKVFIAPWRIVIPALLFNLIFAILTLYTTHDMQGGYLRLIEDIEQIFFFISDVPRTLLYEKCNIVQDYVSMYNPHEYDVCTLFLALQTLSWVMTLSWIGGLMLLILRIMNVNDFRLLKISIYEVSHNTIKVDSPVNNINNVESKKSKEKQG